MKVTLLGTGATLPQSNRNASGILVQINEDILLFDCGNGILRQIEKARVDFTQIRHIFISHLHADHISDLPILIKANIMRKNPEIGKIYGPSTIKKKLEIWFSEIYPYLSNALSHLTIEEITSGSLIENPGWRVQCFPVRHNIEAFGFKVTSEKVMVYSGDTGFCEELIQAAKNADLLIHECAYPTALGSKDHTTPLELGLIAQQANVQKLVLTHFYPVCAGRERGMLKDIRTNFHGKVVFGRDFLKIDLDNKK